MERLKVVETENNFTRLPVTHCPKCDAKADQYLYGRPDERVNFCPFCGQALEWKDETASDCERRIIMNEFLVINGL